MMRTKGKERMTIASLEHLRTLIRAVYEKKYIVHIQLIVFGTGLFLLLFAVVIRLLAGLPVSKFLPGYSDMAGYYIENNSAVRHGIFSSNAGLNGYMTQDTLSVADWLNYGAHGLFILLPYYLCGIVIGWNGASPLIAHAILLTAAFVIVYLYAKSLKNACCPNNHIHIRPVTCVLPDYDGNPDVCVEHSVCCYVSAGITIL